MKPPLKKKTKQTNKQKNKRTGFRELQGGEHVEIDGDNLPGEGMEEDPWPFSTALLTLVNPRKMKASAHQKPSRFICICQRH